MGEEAAGPIGAEPAGAGPAGPPPGGGMAAYRKLIPIAAFGLLIFVFLLGYIYFGGSRRAIKKYVILYTQLTPETTAKVVQELSFQNISFETTQKGKFTTVKVQQDKINDARNMLAMKGLPTGGTKGYELFDVSAGLGTTEFDKKIRFIRATSGELERAISRFDYIEIAKVQISIPEKKIFAAHQPPVRASVMVKKKVGYTIGRERVLSIIYLVSKAVPELKAKDVTVVDFAGNVLSKGIAFQEKLNLTYIGSEEEKIARISQEDLLAIKAFEGKEKEWGKKEKKKKKKKKAIKEKKKKEPKEKKAMLIHKEHLDDWLKYVVAEEKRLKEKIEDQLQYIIPEDIFHVGVDIKFKKYPAQEVPQVKRISATILIDSTTEYPIREQKMKIYKTIASVMGYVRKRDHIEVRFTPFIHKKTVGVKRQGLKTSELAFWGIIYGLQKSKILYVILGLFFILILGVIIYKVLFAKKTDEEEFERPVIQREKKEEAKENTDQQMNAIKSFAKENPDKLAQVLKTWLSEGQE